MTSTDAPGRDAITPWKLLRLAWRPVLARTWSEASQDNIGLIAAGVAFYAFLALVPLLAAVVLCYGLIADPGTVIRHMRSLTAVMPDDAARLVGEQLMNVVRTSADKKGFGLLLALAIAFFGARNGASAIVTALNIAYEEVERRSLVYLTLQALLITAAVVLVMTVALFAVAALGHLEALLPDLPGWLLALGKIAIYAVMTLAGAAGIATIYRYGPDRARARWAWLTPGSLGAALLWLLLTLGFGLYAANFGDYGATYGSLSAVIVLLTWLYLSAYVLLLGAELNSELECQAVREVEHGEDEARPARDAPAEQEGEAAAPAPDRPGRDAAMPSLRRDYAAVRLAGGLAARAGLPKAGAVPAVVAAIALGLLRRRQPVGAALLAASGGLAWLRGDAERDRRRRARRSDSAGPPGARPPIEPVSEGS